MLAAATQLRVDRATVYALIGRGELRATRVASLLRIAAGELAAYAVRADAHARGL